jgi:hypothetical protein
MVAALLLGGSILVNWAQQGGVTSLLMGIGVAALADAVAGEAAVLVAAVERAVVVEQVVEEVERAAAVPAAGVAGERAEPEPAAVERAEAMRGNVRT